MSASAFEYDAYRFADDQPLVRLSWHVKGETSRVAEYHLDWGWQELVRVALGDEVFVTVKKEQMPSAKDKILREFLWR